MLLTLLCLPNSDLCGLRAICVVCVRFVWFACGACGLRAVRVVCVRCVWFACGACGLRAVRVVVVWLVGGWLLKY